MATIRKRGSKWQAQVRRSGHLGISRSFILRKDAVAWAREIEIRAERSDLPPDTKILNRITLSDMVLRYRDTISIKKRGYEVERSVLTAFLRHRICRKSLSQITAEDFAAYRDERLQTIKPSTLRRQFNPLQNMFEIAMIEWNLPIRENPVRRLRIASSDQRRERRLRVVSLKTSRRRLSISEIGSFFPLSYSLLRLG